MAPWRWFGHSHEILRNCWNIQHSCLFKTPVMAHCPAPNAQEITFCILLTKSCNLRNIRCPVLNCWSSRRQSPDYLFIFCKLHVLKTRGHTLKTSPGFGDLKPRDLQWMSHFYSTPPLLLGKKKYEFDHSDQEGGQTTVWYHLTTRIKREGKPPSGTIFA